MGIDAKQLRTLVIRPAINAIGLWSADAEELLMLTAATETHLGNFIRQVDMKDDKGAFGIFQMEKGAYEWIWANRITPTASLKAAIRLFCGYDGKPPIQRLMTDLALAAIMTRLYYCNITPAIPNASNIHELADYWKHWYNTELGKGTVEKAITDYKTYCG
jgi:hypothetical protein